MGAQVGPATLGLLLALAWLGGTGLQLQQATLWGAVPLLLLAVVAIGVLPAAWRWRPGWGGALVLALATAALAFVVTSGRAAWRLADRLPPALEGQDLEITGVVSGLPRLSAIGTRFVFEVESAQRIDAPVSVPRRLSLGWYRGWDDDAQTAGPPADLRAGQRWRFTVRLRQPHGTLNPHGFDLELWLFEQGIRASGYLRSRPGDEAVKLQERDGQTVARLRQDSRDAIDAARLQATPSRAG